MFLKTNAHIMFPVIAPFFCNVDQMGMENDGVNVYYHICLYSRPTGLLP